MTSTKTSGLGDQYYVGGYDLSGDVNALSKISGTWDVLDFTTINKSAYVRQGSLRTAELDFTTFLDPAAGAEHAALSTLPRTDTIGSYFRGAAVGNPVYSVNAKQVNYDPTRGTDGSITFTVQLIGNAFGGGWGIQLTPGLRTDTTATVGAFYDDTSGPTSFGGQAYFQVISITGTSVTIDIQSCATSGGSYATTGLTSSAFAAAGAQRVATSNATSILEFLKVVTTGTFTSAIFAVHFTRNLTAGFVT